MILRSIKILLLLLLTANAWAADLSDYERRINSARGGIQELLSSIAVDEAGREQAEPVSEIFAAVRILLPIEETVSTPFGDIKTDNRWFADRLKAAEDEPAAARREIILIEIEGRLAALSLHVKQLGAAAAAQRSKDEDKRKLAEILSRPEYQEPAPKPPEENLFAKWIREFLQWLEPHLPRFGDGSAPDLSGSVTVVQYLLIGFIVTVVGFLAYKLLPLIAPRFRKRSEVEKESRVILGETIREDVSSKDLFADAEMLARKGDLRGAIRKGYVALLCEMSDRKLIGLAHHKTNRDYLRDLRARREIFNEMSGLTGSYERHWYGSQDARSEDWEDFRRRCTDTIKAI